MGAAAEIIHQAAQLNRTDPARRGSTIHLEGELEIIVVGDIHGNRSSLWKVLSTADLEHNPQRRLILQEIIHGPPDPRTGCDRSVEVLLRAAREKVQHPQQVIFILGNHDVAQVTGNEVFKDGCGACKSFCEGVNYCFKDDAPEVLEAINEFCLSLPLVVRCPNKVLISHTLPSPDRMEIAGVDILDREYTDEDLRRGGAVYEWTWGRDPSEEQIEALGRELGVEFFVLAHRAVPQGYEILTPRAVTLGSDDNRGCVLRFNTDTVLTGENILEHITPIIALDGS